MVSNWEPGTFYGQGSVVNYEGSQYKIIQPHSSQSDWTPPVTPALWGKIPGGGHCDNQNPGYNQGYQQTGYQQQQPYQQPQQQQWQPPAPGPENAYAGGQHPDQKIHIKPEEQKQNWYDLDDKRKQELKIGGGLLAGAAALGAGMFAYKQHEKNEEEKNSLAWGLQNWLAEARNRADDFQRNGPRGPATWVLTQGRSIPPHAIVVGKEKSWTLYISRAFQDSGIQLGKASDVFKKGAVIGYKNDEIHLDSYEILVGDMRGLTWVSMHGRFNHNALNGKRPVEGGRENDGTPLYIAKAPHKGAEHPGKASEKLEGAFIPYDGTEKCVKDYQVLCYL
ncbi:hypothetical protein HGRIS_002301 [Hohenbuehelia grisea]|uniref:Chitin-binding type-3 domain-containing protein n=1 Tax=Hohenbuehelia grisea TaxID=104357 RepID=A0ABR3JK28_9AGAR